MAYLTYFILLITSALLGFVVRNILLEMLNHFSKYQQEVRLKNLANSSAVAETWEIPFPTLIAFFDNYLNPFLKKDYLRKYIEYLSKQLRRIDRQDLRPSQILSYQILLGICSGFFFGILAGSLELSLIAGGLGVALPLFWLRDRALKREGLLLCELPNALEILSLCSEAGLSLEQSLDQYLKNCKKGPLKEEFSNLLEQTRSGSSRKNALEVISSRLNLTDFSLFSSSLIHAERFGTGISKTLRQLSLTMRDKQTQRAEKAVQEMPVKMLLPLILFIMPVTFIIIFGPILLQFFQP